MKILLFRGREPGKVCTLPGEYPEREISDALGGTVEKMRISERLVMLTLADAEKLKKPIHYAAHIFGKVPEPVAGDTAVVRIERRTGRVKDITPEDVARAQELVRPVGVLL